MSTPTTIQDDSYELAPEESRLEKIKQHISNNISSDLNASSVAEKFQLSTSSLLHIFKMEVKQTFGTYVQEAKMKEAMRMLKDGKRIKEIMDATGYKNRVTFYNAFKNTFKYSPVILGNNCRILNIIAGY